MKLYHLRRTESCFHVFIYIYYSFQQANELLSMTSAAVAHHNNTMLLQIINSMNKNQIETIFNCFVCECCHQRFYHHPLFASCCQKILHPGCTVHPCHEPSYVPFNYILKKTNTHYLPSQQCQRCNQNSQQLFTCLNCQASLLACSQCYHDIHRGSKLNHHVKVTNPNDQKSVSKQETTRLSSIIGGADRQSIKSLNNSKLKLFQITESEIEHTYSTMLATAKKNIGHLINCLRDKLYQFQSEVNRKKIKQIGKLKRQNNYQQLVEEENAWAVISQSIQNVGKVDGTAGVIVDRIKDSGGKKNISLSINHSYQIVESVFKDVQLSITKLDFNKIVNYKPKKPVLHATRCSLNLSQKFGYNPKINSAKNNLNSSYCEISFKKSTENKQPFCNSNRSFLIGAKKGLKKLNKIKSETKLSFPNQSKNIDSLSKLEEESLRDSFGKNCLN